MGLVLVMEMGLVLVMDLVLVMEMDLVLVMEMGLVLVTVSVQRRHQKSRRLLIQSLMELIMTFSP